MIPVRGYCNFSSLCFTLVETPFIRERLGTVPYSFVPKSGTLGGCMDVGTLQMNHFRPEKWTGKRSDTNSGTVRNRYYI